MYMMDIGYFIVEYSYKDRRGHIRTRRLMRGTFELLIPIYKDLVEMVKNKDVHRPISKPRFIIVKDGVEQEFNFKEELKKWQSMKSNTKK